MAQKLLLRNGRIAIPSTPQQVLEGHSLLMENGMIARIAPASDVSAPGAEVIDARGKLVLPGFINAHTHLYSTFACGLNQVPASKDFFEVLNHLWWRLDKALTLDECYAGALPTLIACIRSGTTTIIDHHSSPSAIRGSLDALARAADLTGLRACLCYEVSDRDGEEKALQGIAENREFLTAQTSEAPVSESLSSASLKRGVDKVRGLFGLHASFTLSDRTLENAACTARDAGSGVHIHVAESEMDQQSTLAAHKIRVVHRLHRFGLLGPSSIAAHCVHVDDSERDLLASSGTAVVHNPQSNLNNAVGIADVVDLKRRGALVGLGTDAMTTDMREELRTGLWAQRWRQHAPSAGFGELTSALWDANPAIASRIWGRDLGLLREGAVADIVLVDYDPPTPLTSDSLAGHLVFGMMRGRVDTTIVDGRVLMQHGELKLDLDEKEVMAHARESAQRVWGRF